VGDWRARGTNKRGWIGYSLGVMKDRFRSYIIIVSLVCLVGLCAASLGSAHSTQGLKTHRATSYSSPLRNYPGMPVIGGTIAIHVERISQWKIRVKSASISNAVMQCVSDAGNGTLYNSRYSASTNQDQILVFKRYQYQPLSDSTRVADMMITEGPANRAGLTFSEAAHSDKIGVGGLVQTAVQGPPANILCNDAYSATKKLILP